MRILRVISSLDPRFGGPSEGLRLSTAVLTAAGHETEIVCLDEPGSAWLSLFEVPVHALGPGTQPYRYTDKLVPWLKANRDRFDIAVVHGLWNYASFGAWRGLAGALPYTVFTHGMLDPWFRKAKPAKNIVKQVFWSLFEGRVLRDAEAVLFTSEEERDMARGSFLGYQGYTEQVVGYGTLSPPVAARQNEVFQAKLPDLAGHRYLLFLSRIHPKKGCDLLIEAFAAAAGETDLHLVIAGPDESGWRPELEARARQLGVADRLHWPGMLAGDAKWGAYYGCEAFILPSHQENFGIVVAEAMACGKPVLITNKVNIWRQVQACGAALVENDDVAGITALIARFLALDEEARAAMGVAAHKGFMENYDVSVAALKLAEMLRTMARQR